jgi:hypothetical protein
VSSKSECGATIDTRSSASGRIQSSRS